MPNTVSTQATSDLFPKLVRAEQALTAIPPGSRIYLGTGCAAPRKLETGDGVGIARSDVHYIVTEYGIAYLFGKSIRERALALIDVAHPNCREELLAASVRNTGSPKAWSATTQPEAREGQAGHLGVAERFVVRLKPGNAGGGKEPQFKTDAIRGEGPGDWATYQLRECSETAEGVTRDS
jgi:hypothetical protein